MKQTNLENVVKLIIRLGAGALILTHGIPKIGRLFGDEPVQFADPFGLGPIFSLVLAIIAEVICAVLIMVGFKTRLATIPLMITMLTAAFYAHWDDPFSRKELPLVFFLVFLAIMIMGPGKYALDSLKKRR